MGLNSRGVEFLAALGEPLGDVATLGRQEAHGLDDGILTELLGGAPEPDGTAEPVLERLGATSVTSIDASDYEGATVVADLNEPVADDLRRRFDTVIDAGTLEHVFNFPVGLANAMDLVRTGGRLVHIVPANQACGHGFYQLSPETFYRALSPANGYRVEHLLLREESERGVWRRAVDPDDVGHRIEFGSSGPAYLYVAARRVEACVPFTIWPQQSDYAARWAAADDAGWSPPNAPVRRIARRLLPVRLQDRLRALRHSSPSGDHPVLGERLQPRQLRTQVTPLSSPESA